MEEVYLTSDILLHFPFSNWMRHEYDVEKAREADAIFRKVAYGQLIAHLTDVAVFETIKRIEEIPWQDPPQESPPDPETGRIRITPGFASKKARIRALLDPLIRYDGFIGIDRFKWDDVYTYYVRNDCTIETAYHAATANRLKRTEHPDIDGLVSFDEEFDKIEEIARIDPASF
jgi:hypothetical protein